MEILLEEIRNNVKLALESHDVLRSEMKQMGRELRSEMRQMGTELRFEMKQMHSSLKNEIKVTGMAINDKLDKHIKQPAMSHNGS